MLSEGAWENQGLGIVKTVGDKLVWTYTASHLGHWIAAPLPSADGTLRLDASRTACVRISVDWV